MQIYLAGPMSGLSWEEADVWRREVASLLPDFRCLSPLRCKREKLQVQDDLLGPTFEHPLLSQRGIWSRDRYDCTRVNLVIANFIDYRKDGDSQLVSIGTVFECCWANENRIPLVIILEEGKENVHKHPFILEAADFIVGSVAEAAEIAKAIL